MKVKLQSLQTKFSPKMDTERKTMESLGFSFDEYENINEIEIEVNTVEELFSLMKKSGSPLVLDEWENEYVLSVFNTYEY